MLRGGLIVVAAAHAAAFAHGPLFSPRTLQPPAAARLQLCVEQHVKPLASGFVSRRRVLEGVAGGIAISVAPQPAHAVKAGPKLDQFPEEEWQALVAQGKLSKVAFNVLHNQATERPNTSPMNKEKRPGMFSCAVCGTPLFDSATKFNSGTGWPSFYDKLAGVELETGNMLDAMQMRTEVHCTTCGGHLVQSNCPPNCLIAAGHVFDDGVLWQVPTGKRYCINGVSLSFEPA